MSDTKILQTILDKVTTIEKDVKKLGMKIDGVEERLATRINNLGKQLAILDDDAPSGQKFKALEKRVKKLEIKLNSFSAS